MATIIKVCIASPNDMAEERELAFQAATDLDRAFLHSGSPLRLQTFGWEQVLPGLHAGGPQAMIEEQLPWRDADYVVAIFGRYFGKPDSGNRTPTEREVRDAYANWQRCSKPQLLLYFSDYAYQLTSAEEGRQWTAVLAFREEFQQKAKTRSFADKLSFHKTISGDLLQLCLQREFAQQNQRDNSSGNVQVVRFAVYAAQPVVSAEGVAEIVGAIRVVLLSQTRAKRVSIDVELNAPITNPRNEGTVPSVSARLADNSQVAGSLVGINTIRFEDIDARTVEGQGVVISGIRTDAAHLGLPGASEPPVAIEATVRLVPDLAAKVTYFTETPTRVVGRSRLTMGTDVSGVVDDKFVQGETTHLSLSVGTPERYKIRTNRDDLLVIGCLTFRELVPHLFHPKSEADDQGTRFLARIFNSPQGVRLFVSVEEIDLSTNRRRRSRLAFVHDVTERGSGGHFRIPREGGQSATNVDFEELTVDKHGSAFAVWEFIGERSTSDNDAHRLEIVVAVEKHWSEVGVCSVTASLAPRPHRYPYRGGHPVPSFVDTSPSPKELCFFDYGRWEDEG